MFAQTSKEKKKFFIELLHDLVVVIWPSTQADSAVSWQIKLVYASEYTKDHGLDPVYTTGKSRQFLLGN